MSKKLEYSAQFRWVFIFSAWIGLFLLVVTMKELGSIILPATIAVFLAAIFNPSVKFLTDKLKFPRILSILLHIFVLAGAVSVLFFAVFSSAKTLVSVYPKYEDRFLDIYKELALLFNFSFDEDVSLFQNLWSHLNIRNAVQSIAVSTSTGFISFFSKTLTILLITVFMMLEVSQFKTKMIYAFKSEKTAHINTIIQDVTAQISRYLSVKFIISLITGICIFISYSIIGVDFALLWGLLAFALNFIPTFGSIAQCSAGAVFALMQFWPAPTPMIAVLIAGIAINMILGNIIEPNVVGSNVNLSPFIIIVSLSFWGWLWGFIGMILAVPMMVIVRIICENIDMLHPVAVFMSSAKSLTANNMAESDD